MEADSYINMNVTDKKLTRLMEECAELIQICCKIKRFGLASNHNGMQEDNFVLLVKEIADVRETMRQLNLPESYIPPLMAKKEHKIRVYEKDELKEDIFYGFGQPVRDRRKDDK